MRAGTVTSVIAHAVVIAWGLVSLAPAPHDTDAAEAIPVAFVTVGAVTAAPRAAPSPVVKPAPVPSVATTPVAVDTLPPLPKPAPAIPPPPMLAPADPPPAPAPPPVATTKPAPEAVPETVASIAPVAPPLPRVAPPPPVARPAAKIEPVPRDAIADVLAKPEPAPRPAAPSQPPMPPPDALALNSLIASAPPDAHMTASEVDALRSRIAACWTPPPGWTDAAEVRVVLLITLAADGSVASDPEVVQAPAGRYGVTAPESAVRAVRACAPYALPADKFEDWKQVQITFDPKAMAT